MKKGRYTDDHIVFALGQAETGALIAEVVRETGVSEQTFCRWKKQYAGMGVGEIRRLGTGLLVLGGRFRRKTQCPGSA